MRVTPGRLLPFAATVLLMTGCGGHYEKQVTRRPRFGWGGRPGYSNPSKMSGMYLLGEIGDSWLTNTCAGGNVGNVSTASPTTNAGVLVKGSLETLLAGPKIALLDKGVGGTNGSSWQPGGANLEGAKTEWARFASPSKWVIAIQLGINDSSQSNSNPLGGESSAQYQTYISAIVTDLLNWGAYKVLLYEPPYIPPNSSNHTSAGVQRLLDYQTAQANIVAANAAGKVAIIGGMYAYMQTNWSTDLGDDAVHPTPTGGSQNVANLWATGLQTNLGPLIGTDGYLPLGTYSENWDSQTTSAAVSSIAGWANLVGTGMIVGTTAPYGGTGKAARATVNGDAVVYQLLGVSRNANLQAYVRFSSTAASSPVIGATDANNFYKLLIPKSGNTLTLVRMSGGSSSNVATGTAQAGTLTAGTYYVAELDIAGARVRCRLYTVGGSPSGWDIDYTDASPLPMGYPGMTCDNSGSVPVWDNFTYTTRQNLGGGRSVPRGMMKGLQRGMISRN